MKYPFKCPVCLGSMLVDESLYTGLPVLTKIQCRSCDGTGVVWSPDDNSSFNPFLTAGPKPVSAPNSQPCGAPLPGEVQFGYCDSGPCTCPQEVKEGKQPYVGDYFCTRHDYLYVGK